MIHLYHQKDNVMGFCQFSSESVISNTTNVDNDFINAGILDNVTKSESKCASCLCKRNTPPLRQPVTGDLYTIAICRKKGFNVPSARDVVGEYLVHDPADIFKNITSGDEGLVDGGGVCDVKIESAATVIFRVYTVQSEGQLCQNIRPESVFGPSGIDLT